MNDQKAEVRYTQEELERIHTQFINDANIKNLQAKLLDTVNNEA